MSEISLTGGTLVPSTSASNGGSTAATTAHNHEHHSGQAACCNKNGIEMAPLGSNNSSSATSLEELVKASEEEISRALSTLMRFGRFEQFPPILEKLEESNRSIPDIVLKQFDQGGHTLFHWAAKRVDDIRFLKALVELSAKHSIAAEVLNVASKDNVGMRPIHWTCTEGSIPHAALLLKNGADMEARDNSGCTPLLIAAQYGQVEVVAYLLKKGANIQAVDSSRDTALHWAAYMEHRGLWPVVLLQNIEFCDAGYVWTNAIAFGGIAGPHLGRPVHPTTVGSHPKIRTGCPFCLRQEPAHTPRSGHSQKQTECRDRLEGSHGRRRRSAWKLFPKNPVEQLQRTRFHQKLEVVDGHGTPRDGRKRHNDKIALLHCHCQFCGAFYTDGGRYGTLWKGRKGVVVGQERIADDKFCHNDLLVVFSL